jgi:hypothetical protein
MSAKTVAAESIAALEEYFAGLPDPRIERCRRHKLLDIVTIAICSALCGGEGFTDMVRVRPRATSVAQDVSGVAPRVSLSRHLWASVGATFSGGICRLF